MNNSFEKAANLRATIENDLTECAKRHAADTGTNFYEAYDAISKTREGQKMLALLEDVSAFQKGQPTSSDLRELTADARS